MLRIFLKLMENKFKNYMRKIISPFMVYADFESILVQENNGKQNPDESF